MDYFGIIEKDKVIFVWRCSHFQFTRVTTEEISNDSCESLDHRDPFLFFSLDTILNIKSEILKVSIRVSISQSLDSSLNIKTQR